MYSRGGASAPLPWISAKFRILAQKEIEDIFKIIVLS
jgi:hypothetical protein